MTTPATRADLVRDLRAIGIDAGDHVGLGIGFKSLGPLTGGPSGLIDAILEAVGPEGTILLPTFTIPTAVPRNYVYDPATTPAYTGLIPERVRRLPQARRSRHPSNSVVAVGRLAETFTEGHDPASRDYLPYARLADAGGRFVAIGIGDRLVALRHEAQHRAGLLQRVPCGQRIRYLAEDGSIGTFERPFRAGCTTELPRLVEMMRADGLVRDGSIAAADAVLVDAEPALDYMAAVLRRRPELSLCRSFTCLWCRHLERSMGIGGRVRSPRLFQRSRAAAAALATVNRVRLRDVPALVRLEVAAGKALSRIG